MENTPSSSAKRAVVLLNLGGPLRREDIYPFLRNFFMDRNIIGLPLPFRFLLSRWIAYRRSRGAANTAYGLLGYKSPLLENTRAQAQALEAVLQSREDAEVFIAMRYWHPLTQDTVKAVQEYNPDEIILLPLYPQYSTATTKSSFEEWDRAAQACGLKKPTHRIACYPTHAGFIAASVARIQEKLKDAPQGTRLLFSAHGLPEKTVKAGDPYQAQCEATAAAIVEKLSLLALDWQLCYQSRVGPLKWIGPSTDEALEKAALDKVAGVVVYPLAFVSEHVETLVEIEMEYRERAQHLGIPYFARVETVGTHPDFIAALAEMCKTKEQRVFNNGEARH